MVTGDVPQQEIAEVRDIVAAMDGQVSSVFLDEHRRGP
jgi:hypothetical protein